MCGSGANAMRQMKSMPGQLGDSHPRRLVVQRKKSIANIRCWCTGFFVGFLAGYCVLPKVLSE